MDTLLTIGLIGSLAVAVTAMHLHLTAGPLEPAPVRRMDDIDAEFFRIIEQEGLRDAWPVP
ncbi:MAG TPA: hypothetical protein VFF24_09160 [Acidimicrobiia bacterium]|nr:hypothetical protein [Acidimicrobiia bacterium]